MTDLIDSPHDRLPPPAAPAPIDPTPPTPSPAPERRRSGWHVAAIVVGGLALLPTLGLTAGGTVLTVASSMADDGYVDVTVDRVGSDGVAVVTFDLWADAAEDEDWPWVLDWLDVDLRVRADGASPSDSVFVGIARTVDVEEYLADASFDELTDVVDRRPVSSRRNAGLDGVVDPPTEQTFWSAQVAGSGEQQVEWSARDGDWSIVLMNTDGAPGVAADVEVGVRSGAALPIGIVSIVLGGLGVIASIVAISLGIRGRRVR